MLATLDFADPTHTLHLLEELVERFEMTLPRFRRLHHLPNSTNLSIAGHKAYARKILRGSGRFAGEDKNTGTAKRLAICLEALRANIPWDAAIARAKSGRFAEVTTADPAEMATTSDASTRGPSNTALLDRCVYTILHPDKFEDAVKTRRLVFTESKSWTGAKKWLDEAQRSQKRLALVLADATRCRDLIGWGLVDELTVHDGSTQVVASQLSAVHGRTQQELIVYSSKLPIAEGHIRPYVLCETPDFVRLGTTELGDDASTSLAKGSTPAEPEKHVDVESDPIAYELVQRRLRRHQSEFRDRLMRAYDGRCAISGTNVAAVLEAAHIEPHVERADNSAGNGLLLRSDLHALFDEGLLRVHPQTLAVHLDPTITDSAYAPFNGQPLRPRADDTPLNIAALEARWHAKRM